MSPKIHIRLHKVPGRPVISNCGYFTDNISAFVDFHLKPIPEGSMLCTIDVVWLYPNIPYNEDLDATRDALETLEDYLNRDRHGINRIFEHDSTYFKQKQGMAIGTKMTPQIASYFVLFLLLQINWIYHYNSPYGDLNLVYINRHCINILCNWRRLKKNILQNKFNLNKYIYFQYSL